MTLAPMRERLRAYRDGSPLALAAMEQVRTRIEGRDVIFTLNMQRDPIQNQHRLGRFYEAEELDSLREVLPEGMVVLDVGANVGNHALWFALFGGASRVVVVEPNPLALEPLVANVLSNGLDGVIDLDRIGFGLSNRNEGGFFMKAHDRNLGATKMFADAGGNLEVRRGDEAFADLTPDLIKIDVEGMEVEVLQGLDQLVARVRPVLMVEVDDANLTAFAAWVEAKDYIEHRAFGVGRHNANHILVPAERAGITLQA
ncbi:FkbM family methyltransferase [Falsirhodobacter sp. 20TX0035]|uniref:FkbM family methyltransferase n=1 Tax=Falsirhodobacter sp. 20TX0035 TaxID=3022019 RepID=UPI00232E0D85|nr:FkbM family methyltransferase [Falsirhodobacter sp. 20TX0035]MDB6453514.1 FkbM family methyltransferase [Falsirhodobacter sp. 20TX0035]